MARVRRGAILAHRGARGIVGVQPVVAIGAQAAKLTQPERIEVAAMRRDVIRDGRRRYVACLQAQPAQRLDHELMGSAAVPAGGAIPAMNFRTVRHRG